MAIHKLILFIIAGVFLMGAAPHQSGYSGIPKKKEALESSQEINPVREESVRPEEVYKYGIQEFSIIASDTGFFPTKVIVRKNIPVRLTLTSASSTSYCFMLDEFNVRKGVPSQEVVEVRFLPTKASTYRFYCPKQEIEGTIVVRD